MVYWHAGPLRGTAQPRAAETCVQGGVRLQVQINLTGSHLTWSRPRVVETCGQGGIRLPQRSQS